VKERKTNNMKQFEKWQQRLYSRAPLVGKLLRRKAVKALVQDGSPTAVKALTEGVTRRDDAHLGFIALVRHHDGSDG
jgi:hypothetical protein